MSSSRLAPYLAQHDPGCLAGPGDARPTALQIVKDQDLVGKLSGKVMMVTGCSPRGLGVETARALHATGADIYMIVRDASKGEAARADILATSDQKGKLELVLMDLSNFASVRTGAADFLRRSDNLSILVANAAVMALPTRQMSIDGYEMQFATNHLGHFLLFQLLKHVLLDSATPSFPSRVVCVSSSGHRNTPVLFGDYNFESAEYKPFVAYGQSKTANIHMANEIERRFAAQNLHALSVHPGGIATSLQKYMDKSIIEHYSKIPEVRNSSKSTAQGAATQVWAAIGQEWTGNSGRYLEDVAESLPKEQCDPKLGTGYAEWCYDEASQRKLWVESLRMVGIKEEG